MVQPDKEPDKELDMLNHVQLINPKGSGFIDQTECISLGRVSWLLCRKQGVFRDWTANFAWAFSPGSKGLHFRNNIFLLKVVTLKRIWIH